MRSNVSVFVCGLPAGPLAQPWTSAREILMRIGFSREDASTPVWQKLTVAVLFQRPIPKVPHLPRLRG